MLPLDDLLVLDFSTLLPGPLASLFLAEAGARIVKIERPGGEDMRGFPPRFGETSAPFAVLNRGKESVEFDLKAPDALARLKPLIEQADILIEQFRPGVMERLGFGYAALKALNPRLIYCSISGFGQHGPLAQYGAYDHIAQAMSGIALLNATEQGPLKIGMPIIDGFAGYLAVIAVLAALRTRDATGEGQHLDIAMLDAALKLVNTTVAIHSYTGSTPGGTGNRGFRLVATSEFYPTADGWIALGANEQPQVEALLTVLGHAEMIDDPRFATHAARVEHYDAVRGWLAETLSHWCADELEEKLSEVRVPVARLREVGEIATHPHLAGRGTLEQVELPGWPRPLDVVGAGFATERGAPPKVPTLGADTDAVLSGLGLDAAAIAALRGEGVVA